MKRFATLACGVFLLVSGSGCCCLGPLVGMGSYGGGGCSPCGGAYGGGYQQSPCGSGGCGGAYAPNSMAPNAYYTGGAMQAAVPYQYQTSALNPFPAY